MSHQMLDFSITIDVGLKVARGTDVHNAVVSFPVIVI